MSKNRDLGGGKGKTYRVVWSLIKGDPVTKGRILYGSIEEAQAVADEMNKVFPETKHRVEEV